MPTRVLQRGWLGLGGLMDTVSDWLAATIGLLLPWLVWALVIAVMLRGTIYLWRQIRPPQFIVVGSMTVGGGQNPELSSMFYDRWNLFLRPPELVESRCSFFEVPPDETVKTLQQARDDLLLKDIELKVHGVDVPALVRGVRKLTQAPPFRLDGSLATYKERAILNLSLRHRDEILKTWHVVIYLSEETRGDQNLLFQELVDAAIFELVYDLRTHPDLRRWRHTMATGPVLRNPRAAEAYHKGTHYLDEYFRTNSQGDLGQAIEQLRVLSHEMPEYAYGQLLLGMVLAENREESQAIHAYDQALELLRQSGDDREQRIQIGLLRASALLRQYDWRSAAQAVVQLQKLERKLATDTSQAAAATDWGTILSPNPRKALRADQVLLARTYAELAHTYGHFLAYLRHDDFRDVLHDATAQKAFALQQNPEESLAGFADWFNERNGTRPLDAQEAPLGCLVQLVYELNRAYVQRGYTAAKSARKNVGDAEASQLRDLDSRLHEADGYATYRYVSGWRVDLSHQEYAGQCREAIGHLKKAEYGRPNHYALLQNLAMIYLDSRFDPDGDHLATAEQYFERSKNLKPRDYFAYENLALVQLRRAEILGITADDLPVVQKGIGYITESIKLRPTGGGAAILSAKLRTVEWSFTEHGSRAQLEDLVEGALQLASERRNKDPDYWWARVIWAVQKLRLSTPEDYDDDRFQQDKENVLQILFTATDIARERADFSWGAKLVAEHASMLELPVKSATIADRPKTIPTPVFVIREETG